MVHLPMKPTRDFFNILGNRFGHDSSVHISEGLDRIYLLHNRRRDPPTHPSSQQGQLRLLRFQNDGIPSMARFQNAQTSMRLGLRIVNMEGKIGVDFNVVQLSMLLLLKRFVDFAVGWKILSIAFYLHFSSIFLMF